MYPATIKHSTEHTGTNHQPLKKYSVNSFTRHWLGAVLLGAFSLTALPATVSASHGTSGHLISEWPAQTQERHRRHERQGIRGDRHGRHQHRGHRNGRHSTEIYARVVNAEPIYRDVRVSEPRRECTTEYVPYNTSYERRSTRRSEARTSPLLGTIVGGALGNQIGRHFGSSEGRLGATIAGAVIGTALANQSGNSQRREHRRQLIATDSGHYRERFRNERGRRNQRNHHDWSHDHHRPQRPVERCTTRTIIRTEQQISGYRVTYRYHGRNYRTTTREHPGDRLLIEVNVRPVASR